MQVAALFGRVSWCQVITCLQTLLQQQQQHQGYMMESVTAMAGSGVAARQQMLAPENAIAPRARIVELVYSAHAYAQNVRIYKKGTNR